MVACPKFVIGSQSLFLQLMTPVMVMIAGSKLHTVYHCLWMTMFTVSHTPYSSDQELREQVSQLMKEEEQISKGLLLF